MNVTEVLAQAVERHHPRLVMLCSFQKEESVLVDELVRLAPDARIVTIDTGVLFPETLATWRAFEQRFGVDIEIEDATGDWTGPEHCCGERKVAALERALGGVDAWITGIRREQSPDARRRAAGRVGRQARHLEVQPARRVDREGPLAPHPRARPAVPPAARPGLRVDRLRPVHQPGQRPRGSLGGPVQDRVRSARLNFPYRKDRHVTAITQPALSHLRALEAEAIHVLREVAAEREKPALLFSGGKDSIVLVRLAQKAFAPGKVPFPLLHIDTGHNFPEVIAFRDRLVAENDLELLVGSVQASIDAGRVREETGPRASRNRLQTVTLLDAIERYELDACFGGARRDEERARAKERVLSLPRRLRHLGPAPPAPGAVGPLQRPRAPRREHPRVPDLQLDRARRLAVHRAGGARAPVDLHGPRARGLPARRDALRGQPVHRADGGRGAVHRVRALPHGRRHELHRRGALHRLHAARGRRGDRRDEHHRARRDARRRPGVSEAAMEDRKKEGYF